MDKPKDPSQPAPESVRPTETPGLQKVVSSLPVDHAGTTVYVKGWRREQSERSPIIIVHDLGEHTEHYRETALALVEHGYSVYIFDLRGHGRSGRRLGHAPSFDVLVKDLLQVAAWVRHKESGRLPIILGHGIGALITIDFTKSHGNFCKAAILSAPCLELTSPVTWFARFVIKLLADFSPHFRIPSALSPQFAKDLKIAQKEAEDGHRAPYFPRLTAVFAQELLLAIKRTTASFIEYHGQVLILCPDKDDVCSYKNLKKSAALHQEHNLKIVDLRGTGHSVFIEDDDTRKGALSLILPWLDRVENGDKPPAESADVKIAGASHVNFPEMPPPPPSHEKQGATKE